MKRFANITRNVASKCVSARMMRGDLRHAKNFSLADYKSWGAAEKAAKKWVASISPSLPPRMPSKNRMTKRNSSGIVGVQLKHSFRREWDHYAWQAFWPGKPGGITWGINKYGNERAFVSAAIARKLESADRDVVEQEYFRIKGSREFRAILKLKAIDPP